MKHMTIAYATANDYEYTFVSLFSLILSSAENTFFEVYFLVDNAFREESKKRLKKLCKGFELKCKIYFYYVNSVFDNIPLQTDFINKQTFFRLLLPQVIEEDRCIYLDSDTIVCEDLQELYDLDLGNNFIAGVKAPGYHLNKDKKKYCEQALLPSIDQYVNAGVLLLNLKMMRKEKLVERFMELLEYNMESQDQDIINSACYNRITQLPFRYNVMVGLTKFSVYDYAELFPGEDLYKSWNNPKIIHYATRNKPWKNLDCVLGDYWWDVCRKSAVWEYFYKSMSDEFFSRAIYHTGQREFKITSKNVSDEFDIINKQNVVIYGAGTRALALLDYLRTYNVVPEIIIVSDKRNNPQFLWNIEVKSLEEISGKGKNKTVIIATLEKYHTEIIAKLKPFGFKEIIPLSDKWSR